MKKIIQNNKFIWFLNILMLVFLFCFIMSKQMYPAIGYSDFFYYIQTPYDFMNIQYIINFLSWALISAIPTFFKINIHDFAIISVSVTKSIYFVALAYVLTLAFYKFQKKNIFMPFLILIAFFLEFAMIFKYSLLNTLSSVHACNESVFPIIFLLIFMLYIFDFYVKDKTFRKRDYLYIVLLSAFLVTCSYTTFCIPFLFMLFLLVDSYILKNQNRTYIYTVLIAVFMLGRHVVMAYPVCFFNNALRLNLGLSKQEVAAFFKDFVKFVFVDNWLFWVFLLIGVLLLITLKSENGENKKTAKVVLYSTGSYLLFMVLTLFLQPEFVISTSEMMNKGYMCMTYPFLFCFSCFLMFLIFYVWSAVLSEKIKLYPVFIALFVVFSAISFTHLKQICFIFINPELKKMVYITDKLSLFYLKQGKTAVLPEYTGNHFLPITDDSKAQGELYTIDDSLYLYYLEKFYSLDVKPGYVVKSKEEAMKEFKDNGGSLTREELKTLKFSTLK